MIHGEELSTVTGNRSTTDTTPSTLCPKHLFVIFYGDTVLLLKLAASLNGEHMFPISDTPISVVGHLTRRTLRYKFARSMGATHRKSRRGLNLVTDRTAARFHHYASKIGTNSGCPACLNLLTRVTLCDRTASCM